jgi:signal transduction histidine kinase
LRPVLEASEDGRAGPARSVASLVDLLVRADPGAEVPPDLKLRGLAEAVVAAVDGTPLPELLNRIVGSVTTLVDAGYGALGVRGPDGAMEHFIVSGIDEATAAALGPGPAGRGLLGELDGLREPIMLHRIADHPASCGFPPDHPRMETFLGVPVRVREEVLGSLYLTEKRGGDFTADDCLLAQAFGAVAGAAIEQVRLAEERRRRRRWSEVFAEIRAALLSGSDSDAALLLIAAGARELTGGDAVLILLPDAAAPAEQLVVVVADGRHAAELRGQRTPVEGSVAGQVYRSGQSVSVADLGRSDGRDVTFNDGGEFGAAVFAPLGGPMEMGVLAVAKLAGTSALSPEATTFAVDFAGQAALALRMDEAQRSQQNVALLADRERIGRDLHDQVIQRLFATGMGLESITRQVTAPALQARLRRAVDDLDQTVRDIRRSIFELQEPLDSPQTLRQQIIAVLDTSMGTSQLGLEVRVADSVDAVVPPDVSDHALAVLREAVTNVIRHARATNLAVSITAADRLRIEVIDNGVGFPAGGRRSGLANLAERAKRLGGVLDLDHNPAGVGARLVWDVPLPRAARAPAAGPESD